jgi:WD40 repeat protein
MATCAIDKTVALWDAHCNESESNIPKACGVKDMAVGKLYSVSFYPSAPWLLGCGGSSGDLALWDMSQEMAIQSSFGDRLVQGGDETNIESKGRELTVDFSSALDDAVNVESDEKAEKVRIKMEGKQKKSIKSKKKKVHRK